MKVYVLSKMMILFVLVQSLSGVSQASDDIDKLGQLIEDSCGHSFADYQEDDPHYYEMRSDTENYDFKRRGNTITIDYDFSGWDRTYKSGWEGKVVEQEKYRGSKRYSFSLLNVEEIYGDCDEGQYRKGKTYDKTYYKVVIVTRDDKIKYEGTRSISDEIIDPYVLESKLRDGYVLNQKNITFKGNTDEFELDFSSKAAAKKFMELFVKITRADVDYDFGD